MILNYTDLKKLDKKKCIPLHYAIMGGAEECAITLLQRKEL